MQPFSLVISDLHLSEHAPETVALFEQFLHTHQGKAEKLFILGDFVEMWIGDDDHTPLQQKLAHLLQRCAKAGTQVYFMPGNRDFLIDRHFARRCYLTMLPDPFETTLYGHKIVFSHGDLLCTSDVRYQRYRRIVHKRWVKKCFLALPLKWRRGIAKGVREDSIKQGKRNQSRPMIVDVTPETVEAWLKEYEPEYLIHGHTHRFGEHKYPHDQKRLVLGDWHGTQGSFIRIDEKAVKASLIQA